MDQLERQFYTIREFAETTGVSAYTVRKLCADKQLPSVKLGGRILIPARIISIMVKNAEEDLALAMANRATDEGDHSGAYQTLQSWQRAALSLGEGKGQDGRQ